MLRSALLTAFAATMLLACSGSEQSAGGVEDARPTAPGVVDIRWDEWGVPHIAAATNADAAYGLAWAQMRGRPNLVLKLMGEGRGRAAEYWGADYIEGDEQMWRLGVAQSLDELYAAHGPEGALQLDAFAKAINDYAAAHPERIDDDMARVLPVTGKDVIGHIQRSIHLTFVLGREVQRLNASLPPEEVPGSNAWAVGPSRSESGKAMLLTNPHLSWSDKFFFYEAHVTTPDVNVYGVALIAQPFLVLAFNSQLGWTHTVNTYDGADTFEFAKNGDGYVVDGNTEAFIEEAFSLKVRGEDGSMEDRALVVKRTLAGPVVAETDDKVFVLKVAGLADPGRSRLTEQYWGMAGASDLVEFESAMAMLQMPMLNTVYADRHGDIFYLFNGLLPVRSEGDFRMWLGTVDGGSSARLWRDYLSYEALPKFKNPPSGFIQNANEPPWTTTLPPALDPADYPGDLVAPLLPARPQNSVSLLVADESISFEEFIEYSLSARLTAADNVMADLVAAAAASEEALVREAGAVLAAWDRAANAESRGAILFQEWARVFGLDNSDYRTQWSFASPGEPPEGLADPAAAVAALKIAAETVNATYGALDAPWSDLARLEWDGADLPVDLGPGPLGAFRVGWFEPTGGARHRYLGGTSYVAAIEFGETVRARAILPYGNFFERPEGVRDQLPLHSAGEYRAVNFLEADIEASVVERERLTP